MTGTAFFANPDTAPACARFMVSATGPLFRFSAARETVGRFSFWPV